MMLPNGNTVLLIFQYFSDFQGIFVQQHAF